jgi:hypothetical protein
VAKEIDNIKMLEYYLKSFRLQYLEYFINSRTREARRGEARRGEGKSSLCKFKRKEEGGFKNEEDCYLHVNGFIHDGF